LGRDAGVEVQILRCRVESVQREADGDHGVSLKAGQAANGSKAGSDYRSHLAAPKAAQINKRPI
jgi:hypothetical protein